MAETTSGGLPLLRFLRDPDADPGEAHANARTEQALERHKKEGMELAVRARFVALGVIAIMLPFLNFSMEMLYYEVLLGLLALNGWAQRRIGRVGKNRAELALIFLDLVLMTIAFVVPSPFAEEVWPTPMLFRFDNFTYFFVILAGATLAYSWRTIFAIGVWTAGLWALAMFGVWKWGYFIPELSAASAEAFADYPAMARILDPNGLNLDLRLQQTVIFILVAFTLGLAMRRYNKLVLGNAVLERERANLSRYFSPNVVDELSQNDEPLKQIRTHNVAVLFIDIVGFSSFAADRHPEQVIGTLRDFHSRMEAQVFAHGGTLDKYLGDGLMATFGTPMAGPQDASAALGCARAMIAAVEAWNAERRAEGEPELRVSVGVDYGPVVLGDIGANRLEFSVIGNTVNVANRLEKLTRPLDVRIAVSDAVRGQALKEDGGAEAADGLTDRGAQEIRGLERPVKVWSLG
ncbi:adenylate/guanylate cyclase domain-containing protein [Chachezhania antarctica]|uniref:adenylate/guanylate cyclase domain-containing protein n=1 Tax=Chachezhania antarctica TaxID=2340860 RepID=UPI000EB41AD4|nr:adenylate/guanylate cyclase domain-containing protein [Chachezhania antarctica]